MSQYLVTTPKNPQYSGKTYGVMFRNGRAFVSEYTIEPSLGWTVDEVVRKMHDDFGYEIERVNGTPFFDAEGDLLEVAPQKLSAKKRGKAKAKVALEDVAQ